ncbi:putative ATPase [Thermosporothrix hazakensis]|jgi:putative ATPase|uniref:Replication-associated recombination protein A n=2 Tax=Thermosporothrix TaxID=768650 RepID=A0A326U4Z9_THEHA|nr:replication-associated recombination protein A [Thermosporothrix hazakensis]PZW24686.1 putative ATPase [Thermosporothrix hazakensis]BBH90332.1 ATPase AAA [Thermosporothrix sp. COM3]GCE48368.1 ATPase AAA [Thermosporothrix hazakensis]
MHQESLFGTEPSKEPAQPQKGAPVGEPLASRMRPRSLDEVVGQEHLLAPGKVLRRSIENDRITSMIFWGPPGSGKTTLAEVIANHTHSRFVRLSAVSAGVADLRKVVEAARQSRSLGKRTILFIDEIHRFNKAQQDAVLPHVENGVFTLIGATTENPSFEVNSALLSRSRVFVLKGLSEEQIATILRRALQDKERGFGTLPITIEEQALQQIALYANGDARTALNVLEMAVQVSRGQQADEINVTLPIIEEVMQHRALHYDKSGDQHYDMISALHKALRGSDPDAGLYWLGRMLEAGEDPLYIVRRLIRFASEDVGMADPQALLVCVAAQQAVHFVGLPEGNLALAQAVVHLATAPKSNALYEAYKRVQDDVQKTRNDPVPLQLRNAPTQLMKELDYGKDYRYAHDYYKEMQIDDPERPPALRLQEYLPDNLKNRRYYEPGQQGREASIKRWLEKRRAEEQ